MRNILFCCATVVFFLFGCNDSNQTPEAKPKQKVDFSKLVVPVFDADSAYANIEKQLAFGPRVCGTEQHTACAQWLAVQLNKYTGSAMIQQASVSAFDGTQLPLKNIIAQVNPTAKRRIVVCAHWDTRPFADQDTERQNEPIMGANDGGSGVAIILEIARLMSKNSLNLGVDFILFDAEDYSRTTEGYCLGSKYWAENKHAPNYRAEWGILLDMVGAKDARFYMEDYSMQYAPDKVRKVWDVAAELGYNQYFVYQNEAPVIDDHVYMSTLGNVPTIDIIQRDRSTPTRFASYWHTHDDDIDIIDKATLKAVGQTVTTVLYREAFLAK